MLSVKSYIKRNFRTEYFPDKVCIVSNDVYPKIKEMIESLILDDEIIVTIDNEPDDKNSIDCVVLTNKQIIIVQNERVKSVGYEQISYLELPEEKLENKQDSDYKMKRSDQAKIFKKNGESLEIRIIYGGIYLLATFLKHIIGE